MTSENTTSGNGNGGLIERPSFLSNVPPPDYSEVAEYSRPPRLKIIQAQTSSPFKPPFAEGDAIIIPQMKKIADTQTPFAFTPIKFVPIFVCWNPIQMKETLPAVREIEFDSKSELARKCKNFFKEKCPENKKLDLKYRTMLSFISILHDVDFDIPVTITFQSGEYKTGEKLIGLYQARKAYMYACRFRAVVGNHSGGGFNWKGLDLMEDPQPWVTEDQYNKYAELEKELTEIVNTRQLHVDLNDDDVPQDNPSNEQKF